MAALNTADPLARLLLRHFLGNAVEHPQDTTNVAIPDNLKEFAELRENVLLIGQGDYFEIWSPEAWVNQDEQLHDAQANAQRFSGLELTSG